MHCLFLNLSMQWTHVVNGECSSLDVTIYSIGRGREEANFWATCVKKADILKRVGYFFLGTLTLSTRISYLSSFVGASWPYAVCVCWVVKPISSSLFTLHSWNHLVCASNFKVALELAKPECALVQWVKTSLYPMFRVWKDTIRLIQLRFNRGL